MQQPLTAVYLEQEGEAGCPDVKRIARRLSDFKIEKVGEEDGGGARAETSRCACNQISPETMALTQQWQWPPLPHAELGCHADP